MHNYIYYPCLNVSKIFRLKLKTEDCLVLVVLIYTCSGSSSVVTRPGFGKLLKRDVVSD